MCVEGLESQGKCPNRNFKEEVTTTKKDPEWYRKFDDNTLVSKMKSLKEKLAKVLMKDDVYWRQRAKMLLLQKGGYNSKFFHSMALVRKKVNGIKQLLNEQGEAILRQVGLCQVAQNYVSNIFSESIGSYDVVVEVLELVVTSEVNCMLSVPLSKDEVHDAFFRMHQD